MNHSYIRCVEISGWAYDISSTYPPYAPIFFLEDKSDFHGHQMATVACFFNREAPKKRTFKKYSYRSSPGNSVLWFFQYFLMQAKNMIQSWQNQQRNEEQLGFVETF